MKNLLLCFSLFACLFSCQNSPKNVSNDSKNQEVRIDTIAFFEDFLERKHCINQGQDTLCATGNALAIQIENGPNQTVANKIQTQLQREISGDSMTVAAYLEDFIVSVNYLLEDENEYWPAYYAIDVIQDVALNNKFLMTGTTHHHMEEGGAHGNYYSQDFNFDIKTGENLDWRELFTDTLQLYKLAEKTLWEDVQEQDEGIEIDLLDFYDFPDDKFYLPNNFLIEENSFSFLYTVYEIGPYVLGETEIVLPYEKIKPLVKEGTVFSEFLKTVEL